MGMTWVTDPDDSAVTYTDDDQFEVTEADDTEGFILRQNHGVGEGDANQDWQQHDERFETRELAHAHAETLAI